jgi:hypothetical protein
VGEALQVPLLQDRPEQQSVLLEQFAPFTLQPPGAAAQTPLTQFVVQQSALLEQFVPVGLQLPPVAAAQTPLAQFVVQQSKLLEQAFPTTLQELPPPRATHASQVLQHSSVAPFPMQSPDCPLTKPAVSSFCVGLVVPMPTFPAVLAMFKPPDLVCVIDPVLSGAATLPSGGLLPGSVQAKIAAQSKTDKTMTPVQSGTIFWFIFILL